MRGTLHGLGLALAGATLLLLTPGLVDGLHCPLPEPSGSPADISQYASLCAMCSHNEAAVRWNRTVGNHLTYRNFYLRYECYDTEGNVVILEDSGDDDEHDCPWIGTLFPIRINDNPTSGIASVGRELTTGTTCNFKLTYRISVGNGNADFDIKEFNCTVGAGCEGDGCSIDRVCTFSNGTQGVEEGLCTECSCAEGYSGTTCANVDECTAGSNTCDDNAECHDTDGSYWCQCLPGFQGDGYNCTDIDECPNVTCGENAACYNTVGNYSCVCDSGFTGDGYNCTNVDECTAGSNTCDDNAECHDTDGSYWCQCLPGYTGNGYNCTDIDECPNVTCGENAACHNTVGSYRCLCDSGFAGDGYNCTDIDECPNVTCGENAVCYNTVGTFECKCNSGFTGDGYSCTNVDECTAGNNTCDDNAECHDTDGSYWCQCLPGFQGDGYNCTDIDECPNVTCGENAACYNTVGNYSCVCDSGFTGDGYNCTNVDECTAGNNTCDDNAECHDTDGSYWCQCLPGYTGNGYNCTVSDAIIVLVVISGLALALIVIVLIFLLCQRIFRPKDITFDELTVKVIDPSYSPKLRRHSLTSIHSEYENLYQLTSPSPTKHIDQLSEKETAEENETDPVISETTSSDSSRGSDLIKENVLDSLLPEQQPDGDSSNHSSCVSGNNDSLFCPYIDEQSLGTWSKTGNIPPECKNDGPNTSENSTLTDVVSLAVGGDDNDSCPPENSESSAKPDPYQTHLVVPSGYVELGQGAGSLGICSPSVSQWVRAGKEEEEGKEGGEEGKEGGEEGEEGGEEGEEGVEEGKEKGWVVERGEVEDQDSGENPGLICGYVFAGVGDGEGGVSKGSDFDQTNSAYIFSIGYDMTECTDLDEPTFSTNPNYIHDSLCVS